MSSKDNPVFQKERIEKAVEAAYEFKAKAVFDPNEPENWLRFRIEAMNGLILSNGAAEYHVSEIADKTDDQLRQFVAHIAPSFSTAHGARGKSAAGFIKV